MRSVLVLALVAAALFAPRVAFAADDEPDVAKARAEFVRGNELANSAQWAQALAAFEQSFLLRPHPLTTFNMAVCERALGRLTRARDLFHHAISAAERDPAQFPGSRLEEARGFLKEIDAALVHLEVDIRPIDAALAVDGRPLEMRDEGERKVAIAGIAKPGDPQRIPSRTFDLVIDPGTRIFRFAARGHADVLVNKTYAPGAKTRLEVELEKLPATFRISSNVKEPIVTFNGADVGVAPVAISRPAGTYRVVVRKEGYDTFDTQLAVAPGQEVDLPANMAEEKVPLTKRWWFWTAIGAAVAGGAAITYFATRPDPSPPDYSGGTTGWVVIPK